MKDKELAIAIGDKFDPTQRRYQRVGALDEMLEVVISAFIRAGGRAGDVQEILQDHMRVVGRTSDRIEADRKATAKPRDPEMIVEPSDAEAIKISKMSLRERDSYFKAKAARERKNAARRARRAAAKSPPKRKIVL